MRDYKAENVYEFCDYVWETYNDEKERYSKSDDFQGVNIVARYDVLIPILNALVRNTGFVIAGAIINDSMYDGYSDEFIISIDENSNMYVEPVYVEDKGIYLYTGEGLTFVHGDCNSKYVTANSSAPMIAFEIENFGDADNSEEPRHIKTKDEKCDKKLESYMDDDGDFKGFVQNYSDNNSYMSRSFYTNCENLLNHVIEKWT